MRIFGEIGNYREKVSARGRFEDKLPSIARSGSFMESGSGDRDGKIGDGREGMMKYGDVF